jgi:hypothetical protein
MKKIITAFVLCFLCGECFSQAGEWVWMKGDSIPNQLGNFGVQGVPGLTNNPPALYEPCEWTDLNGNFWLFGGYIGPSPSINNLADLWKFNPSTEEWTWVRGPGTINYAGNYGVQGVPSITNQPPSLGFGVATWVDINGDLWLYGGFKPLGSMNTLWKFTIATNTWTWIHGSNVASISPVYGTKGFPSSSNTPGSRAECFNRWIDSIGNLWLFGGLEGGWRNDLWRYSISTNEWTWMSGDSVNNQTGVYGTMGVANASNKPGARQASSSWKDNNDNFWLFGGANQNSRLNDMWMYNTGTNLWTWVSGTNFTNDSGTYAAYCDTSLNYVPAARKEARSCWVDECGNFWLYGGGLDFRNDLWSFNPLKLEWSFANGDSIPNQVPVFGTLGLSSPLNQPGARAGAVAWLGNGEMFLYGGAVNGWYSMYNDLWKYVPDTNCAGCNLYTIIQKNNPPEADELLVFPNPANSSLIISFQSSEKQNIELRIYNTLGEVQLFQSFRTLEKLFEKEINVEKLRNGIYFLQVKTKEGLINKKVMMHHGRTKKF